MSYCYFHLFICSFAFYVFYPSTGMPLSSLIFSGHTIYFSRQRHCGSDPGELDWTRQDQASGDPSSKGSAFDIQRKGSA